jgi:hypothetical protein
MILMTLSDSRKAHAEREAMEDASQGKKKSRLPKPIKKMTSTEYRQYLKRQGV